MANKIDIEKLSGEQIRQLSPQQLRSLTDSQMRRATQKLMNIANKRVARFRKSEVGQYSPIAYEAEDAERDGKKLFTLVGVHGRDKLWTQFDKMRTWLDPKKDTHTIKGWGQFFQKTVDRLGEEVAKDREFWDMYRKLEKDYAHQIEKGNGKNGSKEVQRNLARIITEEGGTYEDMKKYMEERYQAIQAEQEEEESKIEQSLFRKPKEFDEV